MFRRSGVSPVSLPLALVPPADLLSVSRWSSLSRPSPLVADVLLVGPAPPVELRFPGGGTSFPPVELVETRSIL